MNLASVSENRDKEKRVAVTPEIAKKYIGLGFNLSLSNSYGSHLGFNDDEYKNLGVNFFKNDEEIIKNSDIVIQLGLPDDNKLSLLRENQTLIGSLNAFSNKEKLENLKLKKINCFSLELLPRITRAQSMDPMHTDVPGPDGKLSYGGACLPKDSNSLLSFMKKTNTYHNVLNSVVEEKNIMRK